MEREEAINNQFESIFNPETIAVVGASNSLGKWGTGVFMRLLATSLERRIYPVNRNATEVQGVTAYPTVRDIPEPIDFAVIVIPSSGVVEAVRDCVESGVKAAIVITAGLGETGVEGAELEREIVRIARNGGMRLIGPNCWAHFNTANNFFTINREFDIKRGGIGLISQSGAFATRLLECGIEAGVGFSKFVGTGNEADLHFEDFLEYLAEDDETRIITGYVEGLREGKRFFRLAKDITKRKPVVIMKVGKTETGSKAARSHTSAVAGSDSIYDTMFKQAGVIRVEQVGELFDTASALLRQPLPRGNRVGILTLGGGGGCIASDACERLGLEIARLSPHTIERLNAILPSRWPHANPVDTVAAALDSTVAGFDPYSCLWALMEDDNIDAIFVVDHIGFQARIHKGDSTIPLLLGRSFKDLEEQELNNLDKLFDYIDKYQKPVIISAELTEVLRSSRIYNKLKDNGILMYPTEERAAKVLARLVSYSSYLSHS